MQGAFVEINPRIHTTGSTISTTFPFLITVTFVMQIDLLDLLQFCDFVCLFVV